MTGQAARFIDRREAGQRLAKAVAALQLDNPMVLALPRGGVPVAFEVARMLCAQLDLLLVRKIGAPGEREYAIGAVIDGADPQVVLNAEAIDTVRPPAGYVEIETRRQLAELERQRQLYLGSSKPSSVMGRTVIVVDDGIATGSTVRVALRALRNAGAGRLVLAVPVAPAGVIATLRPECDEIVCLSTVSNFRAVGFHYQDFGQTTDREVVTLLKTAQLWMQPAEKISP